MNPLRRLIERLRNMIWRGSFEHWDIETCNAERRESGLCLDFDSEDEVILIHGEPTLIENASREYLDAESKVVYEAPRWLIYDQLLKRTRVMFRICAGAVDGIVFVPKLKRCPRKARLHLGAYDSPEESSS
ncbi:MAG TPA: hypothetical protein VML55_03220 [Planctomycetaceae bacterium]|nr:hypothetical protein [Planctomycetaceae bacterium]